MSETQYLTALELVDRWKNKVSLNTLKKWRTSEILCGPCFIRFHGAILYPVYEVEKYEQTHLVTTKK